MNTKNMVFSLPSITTIAAASAIFIHWFLFRKRQIQSTPTDESVTHNDNTKTSTSSPFTLDSIAGAGTGGVYEVFLSFCGKDTRNGFTDFLYTYLVGASIQTFRDNDELKVGEEIHPELLKAINQSKISIPIFSQNYASSKWCLLELEQILECHKNGGQKIHPIYYNVDPSDVQNQKGSYEVAFRFHEKRFDKNIVQRWRDALKMVGGLKGLELNKETDGREGELVKLVVEKVLIELKKNYTHVPDNLVGIDKHIENLMGLLDVDSNDVRIVGIHGMGGLGKTTIAKVVYNQLYKHFGGQCFIDNVREKSKHQDGIVELQKNFLSSIQKRHVSSVSDDNYGRSLIKDVVRGKKLFLVLDDVDDYYQVDMLMGDQSWFGTQSRIILTTRDKNVLDKIELNCQRKEPCVAYRSYNPNFMDNNDSLQLFCKHAFMTDSPAEGYDILSKEVVSIAEGLPLVLVVLGSTFFAVKDKDLWEENLRKLRKIPNKKVLEKLKFSFEALEHNEKQIFLDIACLFINIHKAKPCYMWEDSGFYPKMGISILVSRSLITIGDDDVLRMHDQLRDLGRQIVREESLHKPEEQSRLWCPEEANQILELNQRINNVSALHVQSMSVVASHFHHAQNLRYLLISDGMGENIDGDFKHLLPCLKWLECTRFSKFSPNNLNMKNLVVLHLRYCVISEEWDGWSQLKMANNLKVLDLSLTRELQTLPNLLNLTKLVELSLSWCAKLIEIQGLDELDSLQVLNINGCKKLKSLPDISNLKELKELNANGCGALMEIKGLSRLISLERLDLRYLFSLKCSSLGDLSSLNKLQVLIGARGLDTTNFSNLKKLRELEIIDNYKIKILNLDGFEALKYLQIFKCPSIKKLPHLSFLKRLKTLKISNCYQLVEIQDLSELESLEHLEISYCESIKRLPNLPNFGMLKDIRVAFCKKLHEVEGLGVIESLESLEISTCSKLGQIPNLRSLKNLKELQICMLEDITEIRGLEDLKSLESLDISRCRSIKTLPDLSAFHKLKDLRLYGCEKLSEIPGIAYLPDLPNINIMRNYWYDYFVLLFVLNFRLSNILPLNICATSNNHKCMASTDNGHPSNLFIKSNLIKQRDHFQFSILIQIELLPYVI